MPIVIASLPAAAHRGISDSDSAFDREIVRPPLFLFSRTGSKPAAFFRSHFFSENLCASARAVFRILFLMSFAFSPQQSSEHGHDTYRMGGILHRAPWKYCCISSPTVSRKHLPGPNPCLHVSVMMPEDDCAVYSVVVYRYLGKMFSVRTDW